MAIHVYNKVNTKAPHYHLPGKYISWTVRKRVSIITAGEFTYKGPVTFPCYDVITTNTHKSSAAQGNIFHANSISMEFLFCAQRHFAKWSVFFLNMYDNLMAMDGCTVNIFHRIRIVGHKWGNGPLASVWRICRWARNAEKATVIFCHYERIPFRRLLLWMRWIFNHTKPFYVYILIA